MNRSVLHISVSYFSIVMKCRFTMNKETFEVKKVDSLDSYNFAIKIVKRKRDGKFNMLFIDELQLNRVLRVMRDVLDSHGQDPNPL